MKTKTNFIAIAKEEVCLLMAVVVCLVVGLGWVKAQNDFPTREVQYYDETTGIGKGVSIPAPNYSNVPAGDAGFKVEAKPCSSNMVCAEFYPISQENNVNQYELFYFKDGKFDIQEIMTPFTPGKRHSMIMPFAPDKIQLRALLKNGSYVYSPVVDTYACLENDPNGWGYKQKSSCGASTPVPNNPTPVPYNPPSNPTPAPYSPPSNPIPTAIPTSKPIATPEATWSTNFVCALWDKEEEKMSELNHSLVIKCGDKEIYNKSNRTGNMNESILLPEGKSCEATCTPLVSETGMYGYTIGNSLGSPNDKDIKKSIKETIKFTTKKTDNVYRWFFQTSDMVDCVKENKTVKSGQFCCEGLQEKNGKCVTSEIASKMKVKILGGAYDANKTTKSISKNIVSMNLECDGNTTELTKTSGSKKLTEYGNFTFNVNMPTTAKCTLNNTSENTDYKYKGYTICQNKDIPNCHKEQKINNSNSIDLTEYDLKNNDKLQVRWYYEKVDTGNDDGGTDNGTDNVSTSRVNRLIELLEKLLEKLGVK